MNTHAAPSPNAANLYDHPAARAILDEALALLGDGVPAATVESASLSAGLRTGVLATLDDLSLETLDHALHAELHELEHGHSHDEHDHAHGHPHHDHPAHSHDHDHDHGHGHAHAHAHEHHDHHARGHDHGHHDHEHHAHAHAPASGAARPKPHAHKVKSRRMPESAVYVLEKMAHGYRRMGRAGGAGFYDYTCEPAQLWSGLKTFERRTSKVAPEDVGDRLRHAALLGALRTPGDAPGATLTAAFGPGLAGSAADAASRIRTLGTDAFLARSRELAARYGERFEPAASMLAALGISGEQA